MQDNKIHITVKDLETQNAVTYRFNDWKAAAKFTKEKIKETEKNEVPDKPKA